MGIKYRHAFAKAWLHRLGNKIYVKGEDFLGKNAEFISKNFDITPLKTYITIGNELIDEEDAAELSVMPYKDLQSKLGLTVYRLPVDKKIRRAWHNRQAYVYVIARKKPGIPGEIPQSTFSRRGFKIEWDRLNKWIRGVGEGFGTINGRWGSGDITPILRYAPRTKKGHNINKAVSYSSYSEIYENQLRAWAGKRLKHRKPVLIKELPVMITEDGYLLCLPKTRVLPKIIFVGKTRAGKTWGMSSILGRVPYIYQDKVGIMNDALDQFYDLMLPMEKQGLINELSRVGNVPKELPVINLYMSSPGIDIRYKDEDIGYRLVIPFKDFLYRYKFFTHKIGKWDLGKPEKYLTNEVVTALDNCKTAKEVKEKLFAIIPNAKEDKGAQAMIYKWVAAFESIFRDEFTSNLFKHEESTSPYWKLKKKDGEELSGHPFIISYEAGLFPVINNHLAKDYPIAEKQMADLMKQIVRWQMKRRDKGTRVWVGVDELKDLSKKKIDLWEALDYIFTQGAFNRIGFAGTIQEYTLLSPSMRANTSHLVVFDLQTNVERTAVAKDYRLDKEVIDSLIEMKSHQCLFITKQKMILYDSDGSRKEAKEGGIWRGKILPPITCHKSP